MKKLFASRVKNLKNSELGDLMRLIGRDEIISFAGGIPSADIFPVEELGEITAALLKDCSKEIFQYGSTEGNEGLKEYLVEYLIENGINTDISELIITSGSQQALDLISKVFINPGDRVVVEKPGYVGGIGAIKSYEADIISIEMEADGINVPELETHLKELADEKQKVKFIYLVPDYSNPSGARLSPEKRVRILELAEKYNFYIIEDTPYSELNYYDDGMEYMKKLDLNNRVILLGSFSKFFVPGLRIGWICGDPQLINLLGRAKQYTDLASSSIGQAILYEARKKDLLKTQAKKILPFYRQRLETMAEALDKYFPENTSWHTPQGGFFFWVKLPDYINSRELLNVAIDNNLAFVTGSAFFDKVEDGYQYMRLSFSDTPPDKIKRGIKNLGKLIRNY